MSELPPNLPPGLQYVDPNDVERGWTIIEQPPVIKPKPTEPPTDFEHDPFGDFPPVKHYEYAPNVRHINRNRWTGWLGAAITKPLYVREA